MYMMTFMLFVCPDLVLLDDNEPVFWSKYWCPQFDGFLMIELCACLLHHVFWFSKCTDK